MARETFRVTGEGEVYADASKEMIKVWNSVKNREQYLDAVEQSDALRRDDAYNESRKHVSLTKYNEIEDKVKKARRAASDRYYLR